jgi:hypothetical protein
MRPEGTITCAAALLALASACTLADTDPDDDTDVIGGDGCPGDLVPAASAGMIITQLRLDGLDYVAGFDEDAEYDDDKAACIEEDGTEMVLTFAVGNDPFGTVTFSASTTGPVSLSESEGLVKIDMHGAPEPFIVSRGADWQSGTYNVNTIDPLSVDIDGQAVASGHNLTFTAAAEASRL